MECRNSRPTWNAPHLASCVPILDAEGGHGPHNGQHGLECVAVNDGNELQAFLQRVTILVDDPGRGRSQGMGLSWVPWN